MDADRKHARTAGLVYLAVVVGGILGLMVIPSSYLVRGDAAATVANIAARETVFRTGVVVDVLSNLAFLLLPFALHRLLARFGRTAGTLMVVFAAAAAVLGLVAAARKLDALSWMGTAPHLRAFTAEQLQGQAMLSLRSHSSLTRVAELFWGLWLLPFGLLVRRSGFLPRVLGVLLMAGGFGYVFNFFAKTLAPSYATSSLPLLVPLPAHVGEVGIAVWLALVGTTLERRPRPPADAPANSAEGVG